MLKLELTYPEMATIRQLLSEHRADELKPIVRKIKNVDVEGYLKLLETDRNEFSLLGRCNSILDKIQAIDDKIKKELEKKEG